MSEASRPGQWSAGQSGNPKGSEKHAVTQILQQFSEFDSFDDLPNKRLLAQLVWEGLTHGQMHMLGGRTMELKAKEWVELVKWFYTHLDGTYRARAEVDRAATTRAEREKLRLVLGDGSRDESEPHSALLQSASPLQDGLPSDGFEEAWLDSPHPRSPLPKERGDISCHDEQIAKSGSATLEKESTASEDERQDGEGIRGIPGGRLADPVEASGAPSARPPSLTGRASPATMPDSEWESPRREGPVESDAQAEGRLEAPRPEVVMAAAAVVETSIAESEGEPATTTEEKPRDGMALPDGMVLFNGEWITQEHAREIYITQMHIFREFEDD